MRSSLDMDWSLLPLTSWLVMALGLAHYPEQIGDVVVGHYAAVAFPFGDLVKSLPPNTPKLSRLAVAASRHSGCTGHDGHSRIATWRSAGNSDKNRSLTALSLQLALPPAAAKLSNARVSLSLASLPRWLMLSPRLGCWD